MRPTRLPLALTLALVVLTPAGAARGDETVGPGGGTPGTSSNFELVGHEPLFDRSMNAALAFHEGFVYVGNRTDGSSRCGLGDPRRETLGLDACPHPNPGILVVNGTDPANPEVVNEIGPPHAGNVSETTRELRVWTREDLLMVASFACSSVIHSCVPGPVTPTFRFFDVSDPANPAFLSEWIPRQANGVIRTPHEFHLWEDPRDPERALLWISTPTTNRNPVNANLMIADISGVAEGEQPTLLAQGTWNDRFPVMPNVALHSMTPTVDGRITHLAYLSGFFLALDTSEVAAGNPPPGQVISLNDDLLTPVENRPTWDNPNPGHSAVPFPGRPFSFITDEVYGTFTAPSFGCPWGWVRTLQVAQPRRPRIMGEYRLPENSCPAPTQADQERAAYTSHNPTLTRNLALVTWHSGGFQAIDIEDPAHMEQVGWFSPTPLATVANDDPALGMGTNKVVMWSFPIVSDGLIYVVDIRNGLYILRYTGPRSGEVSGLDFLEGNSNLGDAVRLAKSGG
ncbi:MAG: LVIVD repeat-containing protein [Actinomycetota bacterium]